MQTRFPLINLGAPGEEISRKDLHAVTLRFKYFNQCRLKRLQESFQSRQLDFLNLLALIFHVNHPLLPGFVSLETPAGIPDYSPDKQTLETAKLFTKGFVYKPKTLKNYPIYSIFLMGSVGSMAFSKDSDIDIWLCHQPGLSGAELEELQRKASEVEKWAETLKIEVHFFLIDSRQFKQGENTPISQESSGETQHYLLLEEFYRTSIYIAGRIPVWWLVPPAQERQYSRYVAHLLENRFISESEVIDFGDLQNAPLSEFVGATLWQIYKSLGSPHKSLLKLFLMETYASEYPQPQWLCTTLKQAIYQGEFSVNSLDPYLLMYSKVDDYLLQNASRQRLNLIRECFHLKIMGSTDLSLNNRARRQHDEFMKCVARKWQWPPFLLENLGLQKYWTIQKACLEHDVIRQQLQHCLRIILNIAGSSLSRSGRQSQDLTLISRKLQVALDIVPGKVEVLTTRTMVQASINVLCFAELAQDDADTVWRLYADNKLQNPGLDDPYVKQCDSLIELICWSVLNGLIKKHRNLKLLAGRLKLSGNEFELLFSEINDYLTQHLPCKGYGLDVFEQPKRSASSLLLINLGENLPIDTNAQQFVMSDRSDPLSYGESRLCFVQTISKIAISTWGEVTLQTYSGLEGMMECILEVFNNSRQPFNNDSVAVYCSTKVRGRSIAWRIKQVFDLLHRYFANPQADYPQRYFLAGEGGYYVFRFADGLLSYGRLEGSTQLLEELGHAGPRFSPVLFDDFVLEQTLIPAIYSHNLANTLQIFYHVGIKQVAVFVVDEHGSLFTAQHSKATAEHVLKQYALFLGNLLSSRKLPATVCIKCYEIQKNSLGVVSCHPVQINPHYGKTDLQVRISYEPAATGLAIYCNDLKFSIVDTESYNAVKNHIATYRKSGEDYAFYLTDIDVASRFLGVEPGQQAQTVHYLRYKQKIESSLNIYAAYEEMFVGG